jgi:tetratricopeptide (TPR) repeat protein
MPARYAVERGDWRGAMELAPPAGGAPYAPAITWFARALGAARMGDVAAAEQNAAELAIRHKALVEAGNAYWAREVEIQQRAAAAWIAFAQKKTDDALTLMREAADLEDRNEKHIVTPGRIVPARELLGDMLLEAGRPALALKEYETSQEREPNRFRGYYGAARAAEAAGDRDKAAAYYGKLLALAKAAASERPELARAKAFAAR